MFGEPEFCAFSGKEKMRSPSGGGNIGQKGIGGRGVRGQGSSGSQRGGAHFV